MKMGIRAFIFSAIRISDEAQLFWVRPHPVTDENIQSLPHAYGRGSPQPCRADTVWPARHSEAKMTIEPEPD